jgi:hypothetical protein
VVMTFKYPDNTSRTLHEGVDYYFTNQFLDASKATAHPIYGSITFLDNTLEGVITLAYNTLGGIWTLDTATIVAILASHLANPRITAWEQITDLPMTFPVIDHPWNLVDLVGASEIVTALGDIRSVILSQNGGGLAAHVANVSNPHSTTAAQVGLGNVANLPVATTSQAQAGLVDTAYMTPLKTKQAIQAQTATLLDSHVGNVNNPHATTKAQVGLGNVQNYDVASDAEALAGTVNNKYLTPHSGQIQSNVVSAALAAHAANQSNPHNLAKDQIGLANVNNFDIANPSEATAGTSNVKYMTPLSTAQAITAQAGTLFATHTSNTLNPHSTTKNQVGLGNVDNYLTATQVQAEAGTANDVFMTSLRVKQAINALAGGDINVHIARTDNPHATTAAQVGLGSVNNYGWATTPDAEAGSSVTGYMNPALTAAAITALVRTDFDTHTANTLNPHSTTAAQVGAYTTAQVDTLLATIDLSLYYTKTAADSLLSAKLDTSATAANSTLFAGNTLAQVKGFSVSNAASTAAAAETAATGHAGGDTYQWIELGTVPIINSLPTDAATSVKDVEWLVSGGDAVADALAGLWYIRLSPRVLLNDVSMDICRLNATAPGATFGYVVGTDGGGQPAGIIYMKAPMGANNVAVNELVKGAGNVSIFQAGFVEPVGISYVTQDRFVRGVEFDALAARVTALETP